MLDEYLWGSVSRISPEAPIPIVKLNSEDYRPGGASNVASNIVALGGEAFLAGVIGRDAAGEKLLSDLRAKGIHTQGVLEEEYPTIVKTRVIAQHQQMLRIDRERPTVMPQGVGGKIVAVLETMAANIQGVVLSDYGKGMLTAGLVSAIMRIAHRHGIFVAADPKPSNFPFFKKVDLVSPNQMEAELATGVKIVDQESLVRAGRRILSKFHCRAALITRGDAGMFLYEGKSPGMAFPALAKEVYDVTGAGDTVIAVLTLAKAAGASLKEAVLISNYAAGIVVGEIGAATVKAEQLEEVIRQAMRRGKR